MSTLLGIDIGGTAVKIGVVDENGKVLLSETRSVSFDGYKTSIMTTVANLAGEVLEKSPVKIEEQSSVLATGQIDVNSGTVIGVGAQLGDWLGSPVKKILEDRFHLPVTVINDANAAALGEQTFGRAKGEEERACRYGRHRHWRRHHRKRSPHSGQTRHRWRNRALYHQF